ncbi:hypothetical protein [Chryseobacterium wanjuense]
MQEKIISLLKITKPFHLLPETVLAEISETFTKTEFSKDTLVYRQEVTEMKGVDIIESGEYETFFSTQQKTKDVFPDIIPRIALAEFQWF